jgi:5'-nucleotidase
MAENLDGRLVVAISSRALFDLEEGHEVFASQGLEAYARYQREHENDPLEPGVAFELVRKLLALNVREPCRTRVEVILLSRNSADTGLRVFNSIEKHGLNISRAVFSRGRAPYRYVVPFGAHLFLSADGEDVFAALEAGCAAATVLPSSPKVSGESELRIAFDGDAVLFSDEAERVFRTSGLEAFSKGERDRAHQPLGGGPFKGFLQKLQQLLADFPADDAPIRTALFTARAAPAHERVIRTLREWQIRIDEAVFLGGLDKTAFLQVFGADIFFDDHRGHCDSAKGVVATGHVPHGVANEGDNGPAPGATPMTGISAVASSASARNISVSALEVTPQPGAALTETSDSGQLCAHLPETDIGLDSGPGPSAGTAPGPTTNPNKKLVINPDPASSLSEDDQASSVARPRT